VSFAAIIICVTSQRVFVIIYFVIDSVRKLLDTPSYMTGISSFLRNSRSSTTWGRVIPKGTVPKSDIGSRIPRKPMSEAVASISSIHNTHTRGYSSATALLSDGCNETSRPT
jgi:hypothetical protein